MREIPLTKGYVAIVDDEDYAALAGDRWFVIDQGLRRYAWRWEYARDGRGTRRRLIMHRLIVQAPSHLEVDHIDGDGLNNQRSNIRLCSKSQNQGNQRIRSGTSRYKGVHWSAGKLKWEAKIKVSVDGRKLTRYLGRYADEAEAGRAYDAAARERWGEFARCNFPEQGA